MAAPSATGRTTPTGIKLRDGYQTLVTLAGDVDINFWEKTVTPPAREGGDAVEQTTMHNTTYVTRAPQTLIDLEEMSILAAWDPIVLSELDTMINQETTITITFPDGSTEAFFGFVKRAERNEMARGTQPEMTITIVPTNVDYANNWVEAAPAYVLVAGT